ncbi:putative ankyrin repeat protein [Paratrimastix pyriformis]|uniref:Ankyrin repeat protein n=1 Tax=Paratrimastix pyriformis TaxID=342808 RepID=A0ABQ8U6B9_9EUKA|nr:putative ankyrin repeat protein [Paratrimastix pyriformis]
MEPKAIQEIEAQFRELLNSATPEFEATMRDSLSALRQKWEIISIRQRQRTSFVHPDDVGRPNIPDEDPVTCKLRVAGQVFTVSTRYLMSEPNTFFTTLLSGRWQTAGDVEGVIPVSWDDVASFTVILGYLENGAHLLSYLQLNDEAFRMKVLECASYFCITTLVDYLHYPADQFRLSVADLEMKRRIDMLRHLFALDRHHPLVQDPYLDLVPIFGPGSEHLLDPRPDCFHVPRLLPEAKSVEFRPALSLADWRERFADVSENAFGETFDWNGIVVAGGSVLEAMLSPHCKGYFPHPCGSGHDIDMFLVGLAPDAAQAKLRYLERYFRDMVEGEGTDGTRNKKHARRAHRREKLPLLIVRTTHAISFMAPSLPKIQVILRLYLSPSEVLYGFDIDSCCALYDGRMVYALPRAIRAIQQRCNLFDLGRCNVTFNRRITKYAARGFALAVPGFRWDRVSPASLQRPDSLRLSHLLVRTLSLGAPTYGRRGCRKYQVLKYSQQGVIWAAKETRAADVAAATMPRKASGFYDADSCGDYESSLSMLVAQVCPHPLCWSWIGCLTDCALFVSPYGSASSLRRPPLVWCGWWVLGGCLEQLLTLGPQNFRTPEEAAEVSPAAGCGLRCVLADSMDDILAGRMSASVLEEIDRRLAVIMEGRHQYGYAYYGHTDRPARQTVAAGVVPVLCQALLKTAGLAGPLQWISIDLDRAFVGSFHHPISEAYLDCYQPADKAESPGEGESSGRKTMKPARKAERRGRDDDDDDDDDDRLC